MKESVTYQAIFEEGRREGLREVVRKVLLSLGAEKFNAPVPEWVTMSLEQIDSLEQLEALAKQILRAKSWAELLPQPRKASP
jgi:hypothetical protein